MITDITNPIFHDEAKALAHLETSRWNGEPNCPHCGSTRVHRMGGKTQAGMFLCNDCRDKFTVRTGSVMERSHVPLHKWLLATHIMAASKKGMSASQMARMIGVTYKTAWFLCHRMSEAHLGRYCKEFDLRYNTRELTDGERADVIVKGMEGKRLTYRRTDKIAA